MNNKPTWERNELDELKSRGYEINDPWDAINIFEQTIAEYTNAKYAVSVDSCSHALFLSMKAMNVDELTIPKKTYISVPMMARMHNINCNIIWDDKEWNRWYSINPKSNNTRTKLDIIDCAVSLYQNMYQPNSLQCISFHHRKPLNIGKGGMILLDDKDTTLWLRKVSYDGRTRTTMFDKDIINQWGYHMYMTPEDGARGLLLFEEFNESNKQIGSNQYPDITKFPLFK